MNRNKSAIWPTKEEIDEAEKKNMERHALLMDPKHQAKLRKKLDKYYAEMRRKPL